ncbi:MAG TPA: tRNA (adenosine(37)-N6)-threonylcarbamoyltransferase complex ATPase subunit type 1 TsaE, partial [Geobacteraceae bacterium]
EYPGSGVAAVEWPERAGGWLPGERLDIFIEYYGDSGRLMLYHIDLYRLHGPEDMDDIGFPEYPGGGVAAVEWPERAGGYLPGERLDIFIEHDGEEQRRLVFRASGERYETLLEGLCNSCQK